MVKVKLQKRKSGNGNYYSYVITLPVVIIESLPKFKDVKEVDIEISNNNLIIKPAK